MADAVQWGPLIAGDILDAATLDEALGDVRPIWSRISRPSPMSENRSPARSLLSQQQPRLADADRGDARGGGFEAHFLQHLRDLWRAADVPIDESHPQSPINPYGWSKLIVERMLADHAAAYGLDSVALRYFNAAGCDRDGRSANATIPKRT